MIPISILTHALVHSVHGAVRSISNEARGFSNEPPRISNEPHVLEDSSPPPSSGRVAYYYASRSCFAHWVSHCSSVIPSGSSSYFKIDWDK